MRILGDNILVKLSNGNDDMVVAEIIEVGPDVNEEVTEIIEAGQKILMRNDCGNKIPIEGYNNHRIINRYYIEAIL